LKVNGVRVEPAEIERVLRAEPGVTDAIVVAGQTGLVGYIAAATDDAEGLVAALRRRLATALPAALRPARLMVLERLPTLANGKVDLMALSRLGRP
jgi:acyl-coenzyme A synthetase/AMP-(fatty) acid ligase